MNRILAALLCTALLCTGLLCTVLLCTTALFAADPMRRAPGFCLMDTNMQWQDLADYRGKILVVEFMQTTCPHCSTFSAVLTGLKQKYGDKLAVLSIADPPDNPQTLLQFVNGHKLTYPVLIDQGQVAYSYVRAPSFDLPSVFIIDGNGMIRGHWENSILNKDIFEGNGLSREIDKLLMGAAAAPAKSPAPKKK